MESVIEKRFEHGSRFLGNEGVPKKIGNYMKLPHCLKLSGLVRNEGNGS